MTFIVSGFLNVQAIIFNIMPAGATVAAISASKVWLIIMCNRTTAKSRLRNERIITSR